MTDSESLELLKDTLNNPKKHDNWDKKLASLLRKEGFNQDQIGLVIGIVAEHRMNEDLVGFNRGFEKGYKRAVNDIAKNKRLLYKP